MKMIKLDGGVQSPPKVQCLDLHNSAGRPRVYAQERTNEGAYAPMSFTSSRFLRWPSNS